jgi:hypothetical protein
VGIDQSEEHVAYARKRLAHAISQAEAGMLPGLTSTKAAVTDPKRGSRVLTPTDAFGRPRVRRTHNGRPIADSRIA